MPTWEEATASVAASATNDSVISAKQYRVSQSDRVLRGVAAAVLDNTPANADLIAEVYIGVLRVCEFRPGLVRTTGRELQADDYVPIGIVVPKGVEVVIAIQNLDAAGAHSALVGVSFDGF